MKMLNYKSVAEQQRWKDLRAMFAMHPGKKEREALMWMLREQINVETREYAEIAKRHNANMQLLCVLDNYLNGLIALKDIDGIEQY